LDWFGFWIRNRNRFGKERNALRPSKRAKCASAFALFTGVPSDFPGLRAVASQLSFRSVCTHDCCDFPLFVIFRLLVAIRSFSRCNWSGVTVALASRYTITRGGGTGI